MDSLYVDDFDKYDTITLINNETIQVNSKGEITERRREFNITDEEKYRIGKIITFLNKNYKPKNDQIHSLITETINKHDLKSFDEKYKNEYIQFYDDLYVVLKECYRLMKPDSYQVWVTANRTVKQIQLPTDVIISELYASLGVKKLAEFTRNIPNKRMPSRNSPTNKKGKTISTMKQEHIVLYKTIK